MTAVLRVLRATEARTIKDPSSAVAPMAKDFPNLPPAILLESIKRNLAHVPKGLLVDRRTTDPVVAATVKKGDIPGPIPFDQVVDNSLLDSLGAP
jgi:hypothetical protein